MAADLEIMRTNSEIKELLEKEVMLFFLIKLSRVRHDGQLKGI